MGAATVGWADSRLGRKLPVMRSRLTGCAAAHLTPHA
jgi:hypothetical protein